MQSRRIFLGSTAAAVGSALFTPFAGFDAHAQIGCGGPLFRFGIVADPQYAPFPPKTGGTRYYAHSLWKLTAAFEDFNRQGLQFVATLGDIIDRQWDSYKDILPIYDRLQVPHYFVLGNHDFEVAGEYLRSVLRITGIRRAYYDYEGGGHRFIVVDGNDVSVFANEKGSAKHALATERLAKLKEAGAPNAQSWNGGLSDEQFAFIENTMNDARAKGQRVIVLGHYPIYPKNEHNLWDDDKLVNLLTSYDNFLVYMNGHNHFGNYGQIGRKHFLNFKGMVETLAQTAYAVVTVYDDRIEVAGRGLEDNRLMML